MAALCENKVCGACGGKHDLCLAEADMFDGNKEYEYACPKTGKAVRFRPAVAFDRVVPACPRGSVRTRPVVP